MLGADTSVVSVSPAPDGKVGSPELGSVVGHSNELSAVIMQFLNKPHKRQDLEQKLIDEIGDVMLRIAFLRNNWDLGEFNKRVNSRISDKIGKICK